MVKRTVDPTGDEDAPSLRQELRRAYEDGKLYVFNSPIKSRDIYNTKRCVLVSDGAPLMVRFEPDKKKMDPLLRLMNMPHPLSDPTVVLPEEILTYDEAMVAKKAEQRRKQRKWLLWALGIWAAMLIGMYLIHINGEMRAACRDQAARSATTEAPSIWRPCGKRSP